jgi:hypothetical protein
MSRSSAVAEVQESRTERNRQYGVRDWDVVFRVRDLEPGVYVPQGLNEGTRASLDRARQLLDVPPPVERAFPRPREGTLHGLRLILTQMQ